MSALVNVARIGHAKADKLSWDCIDRIRAVLSLAGGRIAPERYIVPE